MRVNRAAAKSNEEKQWVQQGEAQHQESNSKPCTHTARPACPPTRADATCGQRGRRQGGLGGAHLLGQLARGRQHQALRQALPAGAGLLGRQDLLDHRDGKGQGLAGAGLGAGDEVGAAHGRLKHRLLDGEEGGDAALLQGLDLCVRVWGGGGVVGCRVGPGPGAAG